MNKYSCSPLPSRATFRPGANHTKSEASDLYVKEVFSRPEFMVLGVGRPYPQGRAQRFGVVIKSHVHPVDLISRRMVFDIPEGIKAMTTTTPTGTPTATQKQRAKIAQALDALRKSNALHLTGDTEAAIDRERDARVLLVGVLQDIDDEGTAAQRDTAAQQHAHNALSTATWHIARGEAPQALARLRRAQTHIKISMGVTA